MNEQIDLIVKDLQDFIPTYMFEKGIPGCAIALMQNHHIVWHQGYGVTNCITGRRVNRETVFEVASNSKIVTAYIALRLVSLGRLSLDDPLNDYLADPWFPGSVYGDSITLRHILSHSSGLGHNERGKEVLFTPGTGFYYSNQGFSFLQEVIEEIMGESLETVAIGQVFEPLGMRTSSYVNRKDLKEYLANGHINGAYLAGISAILWLVPGLLIVLPGFILLRIFRNRWKPGNKELKTGLFLFLVVWLFALFVLFGLVGWLKYAWLILFFNFGIAGASTILIIAGVFGLDRTRTLSHGKKRILKGIWAVCVFVLLIYTAAGMERIPVPRWSPIRPMAEASLRTSVHDMATFLLELADPVHLSKGLSSQIVESQVTLHENLSWGLGAGILHDPQGDALWQWGQNVDFQSVTIIYPGSGFGAVVCTNSDWNQPDVAIEIANRALGGDLRPLVRASHLEFNMLLADG
jgi:CubicO group peptidase (beta-lactamase class C family)